MSAKKTRPLLPWFFALVAVMFLGVVASFAFDIKIAPSSRIAAIDSILFPTPTPLPTPSAQELAQEVIPNSGYTVSIKWGDIGKKLVASGAIDMKKFENIYKDPQYKDLLAYLTSTQNKGITITPQNSYFWINTLWALGLAQKSDVLDNGIMTSQYQKDIPNFASTAGWTLGAKPAMKIYSSANIIPLTVEQNQLVNKIASNIYRPCCGNNTAFPDCNHGMAMLGLIELMVNQGYSENDIYKAAVAFNSYWFSQTYMDLAFYFKTKKSLDWNDVDPKTILSAPYSSAQGYQLIHDEIQGQVPQQQGGGSSCGT